MKRSITNTTAYNAAVRQAYFKLLKHTKQQLATIERDELRFTLQREDNSPIKQGGKIHELVSPLIYLSLECRDGEHLTIHWGFELLLKDTQYAHITQNFARMLYKLTSVEYTSINIEKCVSTDYIIVNCSELYEAVESRMKHHRFELIKHKPANRRKLQAVA